MATKVRTNVYIDRELKRKAKELFKEYGLSLSDALNIILAHVVREKKVPFEDLIPEETLRAVREAREGKNMRRVTLEELKETFQTLAGQCSPKIMS